MSWKEVKVLDQRQEFILKFLKKEYSFANLCDQYGISRKTGYKWVKRFVDDGPNALLNQSKAPHKQFRVTSEETVDLILSIKFQWSNWGPKKVHAYLQRYYPTVSCPCVTTVENILKKHGLVKSRKLRRRIAQRTEPLFDCNQPNDLWSIDFKGWNNTSDGYKCGPFTLMDSNTRFLIACLQLDFNNTDHVWGVFNRCFHEYGLPIRVRSDNGPPFATTAPGRLSPLSIKLIKAGVIPEWIEPGHPEQNGRHERMHLTLENEGITANLSLSKQIKKLDEFINYYNFIRPHEALGQKHPGDLYVPSERNWSGRLRSPEYPNSYKVGKVKSCGKMSWSGGEVYISRVFQGEPIGIYEKEKGLTAYYGPIELGVINGNTLDFERRSDRKKVIIQ
jgi:putative transposase